MASNKVGKLLKKIQKYKKKHAKLELPEGWEPNSEISAAERRVQINKEYGWSDTSLNIDRYMWLARHRKLLVFPLFFGSFPYDPVRFNKERREHARELEKEIKLERIYKNKLNLDLVIETLESHLPHESLLDDIADLRVERSRGISSLKAARSARWRANVGLDYAISSSSKAKHKAKVEAAEELYNDRFKSLQKNVVEKVGPDVEKSNHITQLLAS